MSRTAIHARLGLAGGPRHAHARAATPRGALGTATFTLAAALAIALAGCGGDGDEGDGVGKGAVATAGGTDAFVARLDAKLELQWLHVLGTKSADSVILTAADAKEQLVGVLGAPADVVSTA